MRRRTQAGEAQAAVCSQPRRRCQGDRRRRFPRRAPPPGQSDRRSPEPRFSLFRSHFRPRTGGSAASAEGPSAGGLWDGVGPGRWREGVRGRGGGAEAAERAPTRRRAEGGPRSACRLPPDPAARPFGARRPRRGSKPNSCRPGRPAGPGRDRDGAGGAPGEGGRAALGREGGCRSGLVRCLSGRTVLGPERSPVFVPELTQPRRLQPADPSPPHPPTPPRASWPRDVFPSF